VHSVGPTPASVQAGRKAAAAIDSIPGSRITSLQREELETSLVPYPSGEEKNALI
jgi:hypothetical protein